MWSSLLVRLFIFLPAALTYKGVEADITFLGGGWTPSVVPEVDGLLETTAGSVCTIQLPKERHDLWEKVCLYPCSKIMF